MVIKQKNLIEFQIYYLLVINGLIQVFHVPSFFQYILDVNAVFLFLLTIPKIANMLSDKIMGFFNSYVFLYIVVTVVVGLLRLVPVGQVLWAARNNYFYIIFFLVCCYTLKTKDVIKILDTICKLQVVNCIFIAFEYIVLDKHNDYLGGMFGIEQGCNGALNIYLVIICSYAISRYSNKTIPIKNLAMIVLSSGIIAALSELKFFYFELALIIGLFALLNRLSFRNIIIFIIGITILALAYMLLSKVNDEAATTMSSLENLRDYTHRTYGDNYIARVSFASQINKWFFGDNKKLYLFGFGFGACEESQTFAWANSAFATAYKALSYRNLSSAMLYLELGWTGIIAFSAIFAILFIIIQRRKKYFGENTQLAIFSQIMCVMVIINIFYNAAIRVSTAYLTFLSLSAAIVCIKENYRNEILQKQQKKIQNKKRTAIAVNNNIN